MYGNVMSFGKLCHNMLNKFIGEYKYVNPGEYTTLKQICDVVSSVCSC